MKHFNKLKKVVKTVSEPITVKELSQIINSEKPTEIYHGQWSTKKPFIIITEYKKNGFKMFCNAWADKKPQEYNSQKLYNFLKYQGFESCYIK